MSNPIRGIFYFFRGFSLIFQPGIKRWVFIPVLINILLFSVLVYYAWSWFPNVTGFLATEIEGWLPNWTWMTTVVNWLIWPLVIIFFFLGVFFIFTFLATLIGEPFNDLLAKAVEKHLTGKFPEAPPESVFQMVFGFLAKQIGKLLYYFKWFIVLIIISFIPVINIISPILWFLFGAWLAALEYADSPLGNHGYKSSIQRKILAQKRLLTLGFGSIVLVIMFIPFLNFFIMPVAVAGMTAMWVDELAKSAPSQN
jgi:CysZ protein